MWHSKSWMMRSSTALVLIHRFFDDDADDCLHSARSGFHCCAYILRYTTRYESTTTLSELMFNAGAVFDEKITNVKKTNR